MAEAFLNHEGGGQFEVHSAGLEPTQVNPFAIRVMQEIGIDMSDHRSKSVKEYLGRISPKVVIFVCAQAEQSCPRIWPFAPQVICWPFEDPAQCTGSEEECLYKFREVRDQIREHVRDWLAAREPLRSEFGAGDES